MFAYLAGGGGPPFSTDRGVIREVEVHPLTADESKAVQEWLGSLPSDVAVAWRPRCGTCWTRVRVSADRERQDRIVVNTRIGNVNGWIGTS